MPYCSFVVVPMVFVSRETRFVQSTPATSGTRHRRRHNDGVSAVYIDGRGPFRTPVPPATSNLGVLGTPQFGEA
eukprot:6190584-Amphidinium_carterae.2